MCWRPYILKARFAYDVCDVFGFAHNSKISQYHNSKISQYTVGGQNISGVSLFFTFLVWSAPFVALCAMLPSRLECITIPCL